MISIDYYHYLKGDYADYAIYKNKEDDLPRFEGQLTDEELQGLERKLIGRALKGKGTISIDRKSDTLTYYSRREIPQTVGEWADEEGYTLKDLQEIIAIVSDLIDQHDLTKRLDADPLPERFERIILDLEQAT